jgi:hypothetical protein
VANLGNKLQSQRLPAPTDGINGLDPATELGPRDALYAYNVVSDERGVRARTGWREYTIGLTGTFSSEVKTTLSFHGSAVANSRLFQTTDKGIWRVDTGTATLVYSFATISPNGGWGVAAAVVTTAGHFLLYADEVNGLHYYSESTGAWAAYATGSGTGQVTGVDPTAVVSVTVWKNRVWLTERNTAKAYYLDAGAVFGTATAFNFGQRFKHGGSLIGLFNWSVNAGDGLDTQLVAISTGGDVVIYVGTDPASSTTFGLKGVWFVGAVPAGRTIATDVGGDLLIISALGVVPLSRLILGDPDKMQYATARVSSLFSRLANVAIGNRGWAIHTHPTDNAMMVLIPEVAGDETTQLTCSLSTRGWSKYRDLPILSAAVWSGELYFGTADGRCCRNVGHVDAVPLDDSSTGEAIQWSILMAYRGDASMKQVQGVRPIVLAQEGNPAVEVTVRYDFDLTEPDEPTEGAGAAGEWDFGQVVGELDAAYLMGSDPIGVVVTSTGSFPAAGGFVRIAGALPETGLEYDTYASGVMDLTPPGTTQDHAEDDEVILTSAPDDDTGTWDVATWGGDARPTTALKGAAGMGRDVALAIRGAAYSRTTLVGVDILFTTGGFR